MSKEYEVVDDDWILLSKSMEKHTRQPSQASMKPFKMGRKVLKYVTKQVKAKTSESPCVDRFSGPLHDQSLNERDAVRLPCVVPQHFPMSPSNSPKTAADFMEPHVPLDSLEELPPPAVDDFDTSTSDDALDARVNKLEPPSGLRCRRITSEHVVDAAAPRARNESANVVKAKDYMDIATLDQSMFEKEVEESFVCVSATPATAARRFAFQRPRAAGCFWWLWFSILVLGELGTTIWWVYSIGFHGVLVIGAPAVFGLLFGLMMVGPEQMIAIAIAVSIAAMPALPAYSAVLLLMPVEGSWENSGSCWDSILHLPILAVICVTFLLSAFVPAMRAERPEEGSLTHAALQSLERAQKVAKAACLLSAWVYVSVVLTSSRGSVSLSGGAAFLEPMTTGRGLVLSLHMLGLMCSYGRQRTVEYLGDDLMRCLVGARRAKQLTPKALVMHHGRKFLKRVPQLRRFSPPRKVVALVVAVRRTAPILFPVLAILPQLAHPDSSRAWPTLALILGLMVVAILAIAAAHEQRTLPSSSLRRLPLLLPRGVAPCTRKFIGYALVAAEGVERARGGISSIKAQIRRLASP